MAEGLTIIWEGVARQGRKGLPGRLAAALGLGVLAAVLWYLALGS